MGCLLRELYPRDEIYFFYQEYYTYMGGSLGGNRHFTSVLPRLCGNWGCLRPKGCIWYRLRPRTYSTPM